MSSSEEFKGRRNTAVLKQGKKVQFIIITKSNLKKNLKSQSFTISVRR